MAIALYEYVFPTLTFIANTSLTPHSCSYDAAEDNELSFHEGDRIVEIEAASEDWWQGKDVHGNVGLFPGMCSFPCLSQNFVCVNAYLTANYVEVQE